MSDIKVERGDWQIENSWESHSNMLIEGIDTRVDVLSSNIPLNLYALCPHLFTVSAIWLKCRCGRSSLIILVLPIMISWCWLGL